MSTPNFEQIHIDKANELTDRIMRKVGEMYLNSQLERPSEFKISIPSSPREELWLVIYTWLTEEKEDG